MQDDGDETVVRDLQRHAAKLRESGSFPLPEDCPICDDPAETREMLESGLAQLAAGHGLTLADPLTNLGPHGMYELADVLELEPLSQALIDVDGFAIDRLEMACNTGSVTLFNQPYDQPLDEVFRIPLGPAE